MSGRFSLRPRSVYDENEPTFGEGLQRGIQGGLDWYAARRETARTEGNEVRSRGGERLPDPQVGGLQGRLQRGIGSLIRHIPGVGGQLQPTGTFVESSGAGIDPSRFPMDERMDGMQDMPDADAIVTGAITGAGGLRRVVPPTMPQGALPSTTLRGSLASPPPYAPAPNMAPANGLPSVAAASPERTFEYEGSDNARYRMPQVGERERSNRMLEYETKSQYDTGVDQQRQKREADLYTRARGNPDDPQAEGEFRAATKLWPYEEEYGRQQRANASLSVEDRERLIHVKAEEDRLTAKLKAGTASAGDRAALRSIQRERLALDRQKFQAGVEDKAARVDATTAATEQRAVVTNPRDLRRINRDPQAKAANDARQKNVDAALARSRSTANRTKNRVADRQTAAARAQALSKMSLTPAQIRAQMRAEGFRVD